MLSKEFYVRLGKAFVEQSGPLSCEELVPLLGIHNCQILTLKRVLDDLALTHSLLKKDVDKIAIYWPNSTLKEVAPADHFNLCRIQQLQREISSVEGNHRNAQTDNAPLNPAHPVSHSLEIAAKQQQISEILEETEKWKEVVYDVLAKIASTTNVQSQSVLQALGIDLQELKRLGIEE
eukprot:TRINITY_DN22245_c0_g1_i1.p1 TRINITY_DN22245_c0_g1~~TRINITY_DN22245_c0_g1_i1.p1  ORF type:complete len:178 (-),score=30.99 TRINITY_DN22245_c0_g1_i1:17-550(-)